MDATVFFSRMTVTERPAGGINLLPDFVFLHTESATSGESLRNILVEILPRYESPALQKFPKEGGGSSSVLMDCCRAPIPVPSFHQ